MGIQHYKFSIVPKSITCPSEELDYWHGKQINLDFVNTYRNILPRDTSWGDTEEYRSKDLFGSVIYIWKDDDVIGDLMIEWTPGDYDTLNKVLEIANQMDCMILSEETSEIFEPKIDLLLADWKNTKSAKFVKNAEQVLVDSANELKNSR